MAKQKKPSKAMYAAIGLTAAESAVVENKLRDVFGLLTDSPYGNVIVAGEDVSRIIVMCKRVARYNHAISEENLDLLAAIFRALETVTTDRNFLVHAQWFRLDEAGVHLGLRSSRVATSKDGQGTSEGFKWHVTDALAVAEAYTRIADALDVFVERAYPDSEMVPPHTRAQAERIQAFTQKLLKGWDMPPVRADETEQDPAQRTQPA